MQMLAGLTFLAAATVCAVGDAEVFRWVEAERPLITNFAANPFAPQTDAERALLSGGAWLGASGKRTAPLFAVYEVDMPKAGEYRLYARKFWKHGPYRVQVDGGPWLEVGAEVPLLDAAELRTNIVANWTLAGPIKLKAGRSRIRVESTTNDGAIAFDCFLITNGEFNARGIARPDERLKSTEPGWFAWDPPADGPRSPIDLRSLNERVAGENGRIVAREGRFVHEATGKPIRFWGVNCGEDVTRLDDRDLTRLAALLASRGVNLARWHGATYAQEGKNAGTVDAAQVANVQRAVRIFKQHGIYSTLSIYFPTWLRLDESNGWPGYEQQTPFALLFFDEKFQAIYRGWWRTLLTTPDPATGTSLKDEPAVLSLEMQNEDSLFFWTFQPRKTIPPTVAEKIERRFAAWLAQRHGSPAAAISKWPSWMKLEGDVPGEGRVGVLDAGMIAGNPTQPRARDTARFLYEVERDFYTATRGHLRDELGARSLISASNWTTASDLYLTPIERAANLTGDFIDRHGYYNGQHDGPRASHSVSAGDLFSDRSTLRFDPEKPAEGAKPSMSNPMLDTGYKDHPTMVSELDWLEPNRFRAEAPLLCAALGAQQDVDALGFFAVTGPTWQPTTSKFSVLTPVALAQYPAAALIYRLGLVDEAPVVADVRLNLEELLNLGGGLRGIDARTRWLGKYRVTIGDGPTSRPTPDVSGLIDESAKTLRSATGQLTLDHGRGLLTVDAPAAKAVVGFLSAATEGQAIGGVSIRSSMEYGTIAVVSLDEGQPIDRSRRLLVQVMSEQRNSGWTTSGDKLRKVESVGHAPILVRELAGTITFRDGSRWIAQPLDQNGQPLGEALPSSSTLELRPTVVHYLLTRDGPSSP